MKLTEERKVELASALLSIPLFANRGISIEDRLAILDLATKSLNEEASI